MTPSRSGDDRVHFYLPSLAGGGAERIFIRLANHIVSCGRDVVLVVNQDKGPLRDLLSGDVTLHVLGAPKAALALPRLVRYLKTNAPDVLISALTRSNVTALAAARIAGVGTRVVVCERNQFSTFVREFDPIRQTLLKAAVRFLYPSAYAVIGNTAEVTRDIVAVANLDGTQAAVIHNPAPDAQQMDAARNSAPDHAWFGEDRPIAVAIGRLVPQKDYPTMLRAVALSRPDLRLIVLGEGPEKTALEALARDLGIDDRVDFSGFRMDRFSYLVRADMFLLSSVTEGFPNALIEAVTAGVPSVSTDCAGGGAREIIGEDFPDRIVGVGDAAAMAKVMTSLLEAQGPDRVAADRHRIASIASRYDIGRIADAFLARAGA